MVPWFDLNLVPQPDHYDDETIAEATEEKVTPQQSPVLIPASINDDKAMLPFGTNKRLQAATYRRIQQRNQKFPHNIMVLTTKDKKSAVLSRSRKMKRKQDSSPSPEPSPVTDIKGIDCDVKGELVKPGNPSGKRKRKTLAVDLNEPSTGT